jgi:hypothetical protein
MTTRRIAICPFSGSMSCDKPPPIWSGGSPPSTMTGKPSASSARAGSRVS